MEIAGTFQIDVQLFPGADADEAWRVLDETLAEFLATGPDPDRLERLRTSILLGVMRALESPATKAEWLIKNAVFRDDPMYVRKEIAVLQSATAQSLSELANAWLTRPHYDLTGLPLGPLVSATEGADRSRLPALGAPSELRFPAVEERTLDSGIRVVLARRQALPVTDLAIRFPFGSMDDFAAGNHGVAVMAFEQLTSGAGMHDAAAVATEIERLGTYLNRDVGNTISTISTGGLTAKLPEILDLVAAVLSNPTYPQQQLELARRQDIAAVGQLRATPISLAGALLLEKIYGAGHPYGRRQTEAAAAAITRDAVAAYHRERILGAPFTVFAVGNPSMDELAEMVETAFADWPVPRRLPRYVAVQTSGTPPRCPITHNRDNVQPFSAFFRSRPSISMRRTVVRPELVRETVNNRTRSSCRGNPSNTSGLCVVNNI